LKRYPQEREARLQAFEHVRDLAKRGSEITQIKRLLNLQATVRAAEEELGVEA
jgi:hypothetical protein